MKKSNETLQFNLSEKEYVEAKRWIKQQEKKYPTIRTTFGGRFSYEFIMTGIGDVVIIHDNQENMEKEVTDVSTW